MVVIMITMTFFSHLLPENKLSTNKKYMFMKNVHTKAVARLVPNLKISRSHSSFHLLNLKSAMLTRGHRGMNFFRPFPCMAVFYLVSEFATNLGSQPNKSNCLPDLFFMSIHVQFAFFLITCKINKQTTFICSQIILAASFGCWLVGSPLRIIVIDIGAWLQVCENACKALRSNAFRT